MESASGSHRGVAATSELTSTRCMAPARKNNGGLVLGGAGLRAGVVSTLELNWNGRRRGSWEVEGERGGAEGGGGVFQVCRGAGGSEGGGLGEPRKPPARPGRGGSCRTFLGVVRTPFDSRLAVDWLGPLGSRAHGSRALAGPGGRSVLRSQF